MRRSQKFASVIKLKMEDLKRYALNGVALSTERNAEPKVQILVVDDRIENLTVLDAMLSGGELCLISARSGQEALNETAVSEFAAILLDVQMPGMDGFQTAQLIRTYGRNKSTPIIFLTANDRDDFVDRGYEVGAIDYLIKPLNPVALKTKVQFFVELYKRGRALEESHLRGRHAFLEHTLDAVVAIDEANHVTFWNGQAELVFGYKSSEAVGQALSDLIIPERLRSSHLNGMDAWRANGDGPALNKRIEVVATRKCGEEFPAELTVTPIESPQGTLFYSYIRDISDRKRAVEIERDRNLLERRFHTIFAQSPVPFVLYSLEGAILVANAAWSKMFNIATEAFSHYNVFEDAQAEAMGVLPKLREAFRGETVLVPAFRFDPGRGRRSRWLEGAAFPVRAKSGEIQEVALFVRDVTEQIEATSTLNRVTATIPALLSYIDLEGRYQFINETYCEWLGKSLNEMLGQRIQDVFGQEFYEDRREFLARAFAGEAVTFIGRIQHKDRGWLVTEHLFTPDFDECGRVRGIVALVQDITEKNEAARALRESEDWLRLALESGQMGTWHIDLKTNSVATSSLLTPRLKSPLALHVRTERESHRDLAELVAKYTHPEDTAEVLRVFREAVASGDSYSHEYRVLHADGSTRWLLSQGRAITNAGGEALSLSGILIDITDRKATEEELRAAKNEAERANALKSAFLANMSHEIRTPLGAMIGFADLLRDPELSNEERASYLDILGRNGEQLGHIINDILDLSKVEAGHMIMEHAPVNVHQLASEVISLFSVKTREKGLKLELIIEDNTPVEIATDPTRLKQILFNMVGNAIKFTSRGGVQLRLGRLNETGRPNALFEVADTGIGVPVERVEQIFEVFVQADGSVTRKFGGTGLGLALSRKLARALGGDVVLKETKLGQGTTFRVFIPDQQEKIAKAPHPQNITSLYDAPQGDHLLEGARVLVVDDAPDNRQLISRYLSKQGAQVELAENGLEGSNRAVAEDFDVIIMDIQMPVMDGYTAIQVLREKGYDRPIIALTAHAMSEVRKKCLNVGATDHLTKPINPKSLVSAVARHANLGRDRSREDSGVPL